MWQPTSCLINENYNDNEQKNENDNENDNDNDIDNDNENYNNLVQHVATNELLYVVANTCRRLTLLDISYSHKVSS